MDKLSHLIYMPVFLQTTDYFHSASKCVRDRLALYCFAMLEANCSTEATSGKWKYRGVSHETLERYIRRRSIKSTRSKLLDLGVIDTDGVFSYQKPSAKKSLGHRFTAAVRAGEFIEYELQSKPAIKRFERAVNSPVPGTGSEWRIKGNPCETHHALMRLMDQLELSKEEVCRVVESLPPNKQWQNKSAGLRFARKRFWVTIDDTGRFYSSLANLKKEFRWLLTINGETLCEVDVRACQPLCLCMIIKPHVSAEEFIEFQNLAETRNLYDRFCDASGLPMDQAKVAGLAFLCGSAPSKASLRRIMQAERTGDRTKLRPKDLIYQWFKNTFPEITQFLVKSKTSAESSAKTNTRERQQAGKQTAAYAVTSFELQSLEASLIIDTVCTEFIAKFPGQFIAPIHDAVLCRKGHVDDVVEITKEGFQKQDLYPSLKITEGGRVLREIHSCRSTIKSDVFGCA